MDIKSFISDKSSLVLLLSNIIVIVLAVVQRWDLLTVMTTYLAQSLIIGFFTFFKILRLKKFSTKDIKIDNRDVKPTKAVKTFLAFFFAIHYGLFHLAYIAFLFSFGDFSGVLNWGYILSVSCLFFLNHLFSFFYNLERDSGKKPNIGSVMFFPYARIIPMHLTIIFGGFVVSIMGGSNPVVLVLFLSLKTVADLIMHYFEHK